MEQKTFNNNLNETFKGAIDALNNAVELDLSRINNSRSIIFVVDMINGFTREGSLYSPYAEKLVENVKEFLSKASCKKIFICDSHSETSEEFNTFPPHCVTEKEKDIDEELKPFVDKVIKKNSTNGFFRLDDEYLNYDNYVIVGVCTDICVLNLALTLKSYLNDNNKNSNVLVPLSLVDTYDMEDIHNRDLYNLMSVALLKNAGVELTK